jgi:mannose-1-phosphate guanylyltransferase
VLARAVVVASESRGIVTVGIVPTRPDVVFGYIIPGDNDPSGARVVHRFVEKPDRYRATELIAAGALWNSGIFVWQSGVFLEQIRKHTPEVSSALGSSNGDASAFFNGVTPISVDHGVLERTDRVLVLDGDFGWDDVGTWTALHRVRELDTNRNALRGTVHAKDAHGNVVHAGDSAIVLYGVDDLVVVEREGLVLVTTRERSAELKNLVESLPEKLRDRG